MCDFPSISAHLMVTFFDFHPPDGDISRFPPTVWFFLDYSCEKLMFCKKKAYNAGQIFQNLHFRQNFICELNAENSTQAEISSLDCKNAQNRGLKARFEYEFEIPQMSFKALCVEWVSVKVGGPTLSIRSLFVWQKHRNSLLQYLIKVKRPSKWHVDFVRLIYSHI